MFGYMLVKRKTIYELENKVNELYKHVNENAGFIDENGELNNSVFSMALSEKRLYNWEKFQDLNRQITNLFCKLYK